MTVRSRVTTEYLRYPVGGRLDGAAIDPSIYPVSFNFTAPNAEPALDDPGLPGEWELDGTTHLARIEVGPSGDIALDLGRYGVWVRVVNSPNVPWRRVDTLTINRLGPSTSDGPRQTVCSPWATLADVERFRGTATAALDGMEAMLEAASDLLFAASGYRWPGLCTDTVRPCGRVTGTDSPAWHGSVSTTPVMWTWQESWGFCSCNRPLSRACGCSGPSEITLGASPVVSIERVTVDGLDLDPSLYTVHDWRWLVRLRDPDGTRRAWPCCQSIDKPATEEGTWEVEFTYGANPPPAGVLANVDLAVELLRANSGEDCALPPRVTSMIRQGVQVALIDPMAVVAAGGFGVYSVDTFLGHLPKHRASSVHVPGWGSRVRRRTG